VSDYPSDDPGPLGEAGVDQHVWETEWHQLEADLVDAPAEALPEVHDLVERIMRANGYPVDGEPTLEIHEDAEPEVMADFREARRITRLVERGETVDPGDIGFAVVAYRRLYESMMGRYEVETGGVDSGVGHADRDADAP
jgi:hypothetical protein